MNYKRLTREQMITLANKLTAKMDIKSFSNDGCDVMMTGHLRNKDVAIIWEVVDGIQELRKIMTEQGWTVYTLA